MKNLMAILMMVPGIASANFCPIATPLIKQFQSQKTWKPQTVKEPGVSLPMKGFVDEDNNFFPDEQFARTEQDVTLELDPMNGDNSEFKNFCKDYEQMGDVLTAFRVSQAGNRYHLRMRYLPNTTQFNNDPFLNLKTHEYKVSLEVAGDSLIGRLPRKKELIEKAVRDVEDQLKLDAPVGIFEIALENWDDLACDLVQGKAKLGIVRDLYSDSTFVQMEEVAHPRDIRTLYQEWKSQLEKIHQQDQLMFTAGVVLETLRQTGTIGDFQNETAIKMIKKVRKPNKTGIEWLATQELECLADSLQNYQADFTQYTYNVTFKLNKQESLK